MMRKICSCILAIVTLFLLTTAAFAAANPPDAVPNYNNTNDATCYLSINSSGKATVTVSYKGKSNIASGAKIDTYIEKRVLGLFWIRVDIGQPGNTWSDTISGVQGTRSHSVQLSETGTYRATAVFTISGSGGAPDVITRTSTATYE